MRALSAPHRARLQAALDRGTGGYTLDDILAQVATGEMQIWMGEAATVATQIVTMPRRKVCQIALVAGDYDELMKIEIDIAQWARAQGCVALMQTGRRGWTRRLGKEWRETFVAMERNLE